MDKYRFRDSLKLIFYCTLSTDRQYTVYLNITNEDYKEGLRDHESLEFLNFAQAVRAAVCINKILV